MSQSKQRRQHAPSWLVIAALAVALPLGLYGQGGQGRGGRGGGAAPAAGAPAVPGVPPGAGGAAAAPAGQGRGGPAAGGGGAGARGQAPVDVTGYWVSVVDEDYIERMFPDSPRSGVPRGGGGGGAGAGGRGGGRGGAQPGGAAVAGDTCRAYGAGGSMRLPGRLHITWQDDNTLKVEMDSGTQTRLLRFGGTPPPSSEKSLQGYSVATWEIGGGGRGGGRGGGGGGGGAPATRWGSLNVVTTNMTAGYLLTSRSNYTENATLTEYFQRHSDFGSDYMTVVAIIAEPGGNRPNTTSSTFKKEPDGSKFSPSGCTVVR